MSNQTHTAWRCIGKLTMYVQTVNHHNAGDAYTYSSKLSDAAELSEAQCKAFCAYMKDCSTVGFWA
jgi:hypothetical protein